MTAGGKGGEKAPGLRNNLSKGLRAQPSENFIHVAEWRVQGEKTEMVSALAHNECSININIWV